MTSVSDRERLTRGKVLVLDALRKDWTTLVQLARITDGVLTGQETRSMLMRMVRADVVTARYVEGGRFHEGRRDPREYAHTELVVARMREMAAQRERAQRRARPGHGMTVFRTGRRIA